MEHRLPPYLWLKPIYTVFLLVILITLTSCKERIENPENSDPIYLDLDKQIKEAAGLVASEEKALKESQEKLKVLPPRDVLRGQMTREVYSHEKNLVQCRQRKMYFEVRAEQRKEYDQKAYEIAFSRDKPWPDAQEVAEYKKIKQLQSAPRSWDARVPKTTRYNKAPPPAPAKDEKAAGEEHKAEH